ncbi:endonuclease YncB(thermonuclease family) [Rhizobium sp. PP-CC-2G-626]|nr:endonuclease YncB(thermonuclease family) [Rhizobium sp. PP-CC-2G-626]
MSPTPRFLTAFVILCSILYAFPSPATSAPVAVTRVIDGDTLEIGGTTYRLHGIDAPEAAQTCKRANGSSWPCGKQAIEALEGFTAGGGLTCDDRGEDLYGRTISVCSDGNGDVNARLVSLGLAWAFRKYSIDYVEQELSARNARLGVWQTDNMTPWDFRAGKWKVAQQDSPEGCPIKGNISDGGRIYHAPWSPWYAKTKVSVDKGERWFCSEADALAAGWRAPSWGR